MQIQNWQLEIDYFIAVPVKVLLFMTDWMSDGFKNSICTVWQSQQAFFLLAVIDLEFSESDFALAQTSMFCDTATALG